MNRLFLLLTALTITTLTHAQSVGIGTNNPNPSAMLDVSSTTKGLLIPRMTTAQMKAIATPAKGLLVFNSIDSAIYMRRDSGWVNITTAATTGGWGTTGNAGTDPTKNFIGTTDDKDLVFKINNSRAGLISATFSNTSWGAGALNPGTTGTGNTAIGSLSLSANTTGIYNTATGYGALYANISGIYNTANGFYALKLNTKGNANTAIGYQSLNSNTTGSNNTALGYRAGEANIGDGNIFIGFGAGANANSSNKLYIHNDGTDSTKALIYGEFDNKILSLGGTGGKVGIGTTSPNSLLHILNDNTDANASQMIIEGNSNYGASTTSGIEFRSNYSSALSGPSGRIKSYYASSNYTDAKTTFQTIAAGPAFVDVMTLTNGMVGIGTTSPAAKLHAVTSGTDIAVKAEATNSTGTALQVEGNIKVAGANKAAYQTVTQNSNYTADGYITSNYSKIVYPNELSTDILIVTPNWNNSVYCNFPIGVFYASGTWYVFRQDLQPMPVNASFNILIIRQ